VLRIGLTGGIACGKSLVAGFFREAGATVVNDDDAARDAVALGTPGLAAVVAEFGQEVLVADGSLDRPKLGRIVFADDRLRRRLMGITFPFIGRLILERIAAAEATGASMVVYESALLVENGRLDGWRPLVVVTTTADAQLARLRARNDLNREEALDRVRSQQPIAEKAALADHVIDNSGTAADARWQFDRVYAALVSRSAS
jgi:dephospho-CoA kinase